MTELFVYWLQTDDDRKAIVTALENKGAKTYAQIYDPTGDWDKAKIECLGRCATPMSPGVVSLERRTQMKKHGTKRWYNSYPRGDFWGFVGWLLFTAVWLVLQGLGRIEEFFLRCKEKD